MANVLEPSLAGGPGPESSDRSFGLVFATVFSVVGGLPLLRLEQPRWWAFGVAAVFTLLAVLWPDLLHPLNRAWLALGRLLHRVVSPLVMSAVFFLCVTPVAWIMRQRGKDVLSLARRPDLSSYWIAREPSPPPSETMKRQFCTGHSPADSSHADPCRALAFPACAQEILAHADRDHAPGVRRPRHPGAGIGRRALHLHAVLEGCSKLRSSRSRDIERESGGSPRSGFLFDITGELICAAGNRLMFRELTKQLL
jgi:hypothetical protein